MDLLPNVEQEEKIEVSFTDNLEIIDESLEEPSKQEDEEESMPVVNEREKIQVEEVFKKAELLQDAPTIKKVKRTRRMTPEALEKLKIAREKALETRKKNTAMRKEGKLPTKKEIKENEIKEQEEKKRPVINNITHETKNITNNITEDDIKRIASQASAQATADALAGYEAVRKERKEAKKKKKEVENHRVNVAKTINRAIGRNDPNFFDNCF